MQGGSGDRPGWSRSEFREVSELLLDFVSRHAAAGPRLRAFGRPARVVFTDLGLVLNIRPSGGKRLAAGHNLAWKWGDGRRDPAPFVVLELTSTTASRCAQGKEVVPLAISRGSVVVRAEADPKSRDEALDLLPAVLPLRKPWVALLREKGHHRFVA